MGINNINVLKADDDAFPLKHCPNIYFVHEPHVWGEKGRNYFCDGDRTALPPPGAVEPEVPPRV